MLGSGFLYPTSSSFLVCFFILVGAPSRSFLIQGKGIGEKNFEILLPKTVYLPLIVCWIFFFFNLLPLFNLIPLLPHGLFFLFKFYVFTFWGAVLGLCSCEGFSLVAVHGGCVVHGLLIEVASLVAEHGL